MSSVIQAYLRAPVEELPLLELDDELLLDLELLLLDELLVLAEPELLVLPERLLLEFPLLGRAVVALLLLLELLVRPTLLLPLLGRLAPLLLPAGLPFGRTVAPLLLEPLKLF